mmetsp:Transcript_3461/g.4698  ORF Transcript_3461/g.4698 Transcript_3461/m.4698 type:complete len:97 (-) Transcript_3461:592-882(-)
MIFQRYFQSKDDKKRQQIEQIDSPQKNKDKTWGALPDHLPKKAGAAAAPPAKKTTAAKKKPEKKAKSAAVAKDSSDNDATAESSSNKTVTIEACKQ